MNTVLNSPAEPVLPPANDIHITFDNSQEVGFSSGRIQEGAKVAMRICTATTYIEPQPPTNLQQSDTVFNDRCLIDQSDIAAKLNTLEEEVMREFSDLSLFFN